MKALITTLALLASTSAFAAHDGQLGPCQGEAQRAILALAKINGLPTKPDSEYNKLVVDRVSGEDQGDQVINWRSADGRFTLTTVNRASCLVESIQFNPQP